MTTSERWRKSTFSSEDGACVELAHVGMLRDSKKPQGPILAVPLAGLLAIIKTGRIGKQ